MRLQRIVNKQGYGMYEQLTPEERPDLAIGRHFEYVQALPAPLVPPATVSRVTVRQASGDRSDPES